MSYEDMAKDLVSLLDQLEIDKALTIGKFLLYEFKYYKNKVLKKNRECNKNKSRTARALLKRVFTTELRPNFWRAESLDPELACLLFPEFLFVFRVVGSRFLGCGFWVLKTENYLCSLSQLLAYPESCQSEHRGFVRSNRELK